MALDHKYISRGDNTIQLDSDGNITNYNAEIKGAKPSSWAVEEVSNAIVLGIIPYKLQCDYQQNITREEFCETIIQMLLVKFDVQTPEELLVQHGFTMLDNLFTDTSNPYVYAANLLGIVNGSSEDTFSPRNSIARQEAATMLARAASVLGVSIEDAPNATFSDGAKIQSWASDAVNYVCYAEIMKGVSEDSFDPDGTLTREQAYLSILRLYSILDC